MQLTLEFGNSLLQLLGFGLGTSYLCRTLGIIVSGAPVLILNRLTILRRLVHCEMPKKEEKKEHTIRIC